MPIGDPRDGLFYPILTLMMDSYSQWLSFDIISFLTSELCNDASPVGVSEIIKLCHMEDEQRYSY